MNSICTIPFYIVIDKVSCRVTVEKFITLVKGILIFTNYNSFIAIGMGFYTSF